MQKVKYVHFLLSNSLFQCIKFVSERKADMSNYVGNTEYNFQLR